MPAFQVGSRSSSRLPLGVEEIELTSREMTFRAVNQLFDGDFLLVKNFAGLDQRLRRDGERVMDARLVI
jgi:hypothetical protein